MSNQKAGPTVEEEEGEDEEEDEEEAPEFLYFPQLESLDGESGLLWNPQELPVCKTPTGPIVR